MGWIEHGDDDIWSSSEPGGPDLEELAAQLDEELEVLYPHGTPMPRGRTPEEIANEETTDEVDFGVCDRLFRELWGPGHHYALRRVKEIMEAVKLRYPPGSARYAEAKARDDERRAAVYAEDELARKRAGMLHRIELSVLVRRITSKDDPEEWFECERCGCGVADYEWDQKPAGGVTIDGEMVCGWCLWDIVKAIYEEKGGDELLK